MKRLDGLGTEVGVVYEPRMLAMLFEYGLAGLSASGSSVFARGNLPGSTANGRSTA